MNGKLVVIGLTTLIDRQGVQKVNYLGDRWKEGEILKDIADLAKAS